MPASRLRRLRALLRSTASSESMDRLNDIPLRPADARPRPAPAMVMAPDKSRFQRHSAHLRMRIVASEDELLESSVKEGPGDPTDEGSEAATAIPDQLDAVAPTDVAQAQEDDEAGGAESGELPGQQEFDDTSVVLSDEADER